MRQNSDKLDEIATDLDDLTTTVEELRNEASTPEECERLERLQNALGEAGDIADQLEDTEE